MKLFVKPISVLMILCTLMWAVPSHSQAISLSYGVQKFSDVPENHYAFAEIHKLRALNITSGTGDNNYGLGKKTTRAEFVRFLKNLMKWDDYNPEKGSFQDNTDHRKWYYTPIETALKNGAIKNDSTKFRPNDYITREEMAVMLIRSLGYESLAKQLSYLGSPFSDVGTNVEYITMAKDLGIIYGIGQNRFNPYGSALREDAAAMLMRMYDRLNHPLDELHAFYAVKSYPQVNMIEKLDSVSFGWSCLLYDENRKQVVLDTSHNKYGFTIPQGFSEPVGLAKKNNIKTQLMVFASQDDKAYDENKKAYTGLLEYILSTSELRSNVIQNIIRQIAISGADGSNVVFDGVVIDFEAMKGNTLKNNFISFLSELRNEMTKSGIKNLYVAVHPRSKKLGSYDAYDYRRIGEIADKVILMAHDYNAKILNEQEMAAGDRFTKTPLSPIDEVYYALREITNKDTGVRDRKKIWLQTSFASAQWEVKNGQVVNSKPYTPDYERILNRIQNSDSTMDLALNYSNQFENSYLTYGSGDSKYILWYEDSRSIEAKIKLARMFDINGISLWRLGNIPDFQQTVDGKAAHLDVWRKLQEFRN